MMEERVPLFLCKKEGQVLFCTRPSRPCEKRNNFIDCGSIQSFLDELRTHEPIKDLLIDVCIFQTLNFVDVLINFNFLRLQTSMNNLSKNWKTILPITALLSTSLLKEIRFKIAKKIFQSNHWPRNRQRMGWVLRTWLLGLNYSLVQTWRK